MAASTCFIPRSPGAGGNPSRAASGATTPRRGGEAADPRQTEQAGPDLPGEPCKLNVDGDFDDEVQELFRQNRIDHLSVTWMGDEDVKVFAPTLRSAAFLKEVEIQCVGLYAKSHEILGALADSPSPIVRVSLPAFQTRADDALARLLDKDGLHDIIIECPNSLLLSELQQLLIDGPPIAQARHITIVGAPPGVIMRLLAAKQPSMRLTFVTTDAVLRQCEGIGEAIADVPWNLAGVEFTTAHEEATLPGQLNAACARAFGEAEQVRLTVARLYKELMPSGLASRSQFLNLPPVGHETRPVGLESFLALLVATHVQSMLAGCRSVNHQYDSAGDFYAYSDNASTIRGRFKDPKSIRARAVAAASLQAGTCDGLASLAFTLSTAVIRQLYETCPELRRFLPVAELTGDPKAGRKVGGGDPAWGHTLVRIGPYLLDVWLPFPKVIEKGASPLSLDQSFSIYDVRDAGRRDRAMVTDLEELERLLRQAPPRGKTPDYRSRSHWIFTKDGKDGGEIRTWHNIHPDHHDSKNLTLTWNGLSIAIDQVPLADLQLRMRRFEEGVRARKEGGEPEMKASPRRKVPKVN